MCGADLPSMDGYELIIVPVNMHQVEKRPARAEAGLGPGDFLDPLRDLGRDGMYRSNSPTATLFDGIR